jgi:hypothetical protein
VEAGPAQQPPKRLTFRGSRELSSTVFRAVASSPPTIEDFRSYADRGLATPTMDYLRASTVSMFLTRGGLESVRHAYGLPPETAELELRHDKKIRWAVTDEETGHIEVLAPSEVLLGCVVSHS